MNLGCFYHVERLKERRWEVIACTKGYQAEYRKAYACLHAAGAVTAENEARMLECCATEKLERSVKNIWTRERGRRRKMPGGETRRFLGGLTPRGRVWCSGSIAALCSRVYELCDPCHLGARTLEHLRAWMIEDGYAPIVCMDPDVPGRINHLLVPELGVGFVTTDRRFSLPEKPGRKLRLDRMMDAERCRALRGGTRLKERLADALVEEGVQHLHAAGEKHDELEMIYHPFVDFDGVLAVAEGECRRIFGRM